MSDTDVPKRLNIFIDEDTYKMLSKLIVDLTDENNQKATYAYVIKYALRETLKLREEESR